MKPATLNRLMLVVLYGCIAVVLVFIATLHLTLPYTLVIGPTPVSETEVRYTIAIICCYLGGVGAIALLCILAGMVRSLSGDPFVQRNVDCLRRMGYIATAMSVCAFVSAALYGFRPMLLLIGMMLLFCAMLSLVLAGVFRQAVSYKDENELVI